jgi:hypothetical protein
MLAACWALIRVEPAARPLVSINVPELFLLWYSQNLSDAGGEPPVMVQPALEMWLPISQST